MMNFSTLQGLTIPEGVVTQIAKDGVVLWKLETSKPIILEVEKITSDTYAGSTTYAGEQFILLDIYPKKSNSTISVTYGGLTKKLTFNGINAQQVFFGKFNGISDEVGTPTSGTLTINGDCDAFGCGLFKIDSKSTQKSSACITKVESFGDVSFIPNDAFGSDTTTACKKLTNLIIPNSVKTIGDHAFSYCTGLTSITLPNSLTSIGEHAFSYCTGLTSITFPNSLTNIGSGAFTSCTGLTSITFPNSLTNIGSGAFMNCTGLTSVTFENTSNWHAKTSASSTNLTLTNPTKNATLLKDTYTTYEWYRE